jgi:tRNA (adenine57-N1/adenine58-N1)-methyltransferase catalytic subunit
LFYYVVEIKDHGLADYATVYHRDVCNDGFKLENVADAVFLDLPSPWKALLSAKQALKIEGKIDFLYYVQFVHL